VDAQFRNSAGPFKGRAEYKYGKEGRSGTREDWRSLSDEVEYDSPCSFEDFVPSSGSFYVESTQKEKKLLDLEEQELREYYEEYSASFRKEEE